MWCSYCDGTPIEDHGYCKNCLDLVSHLCLILGQEVTEKLNPAVLQEKVKSNPPVGGGGEIKPPKPLTIDQELQYFPEHPRKIYSIQDYKRRGHKRKRTLEPIEGTTMICGLYVPT